MTSFFQPAVPNTVITAEYVNTITDALSTVMSGSFAVGLTVQGGVSANGTITTINQPLTDYSTNVATTQWVKEQGYALFVSNSVSLPPTGIVGTYNLITTDAEGRVVSGMLVPINVTGDMNGGGTLNNIVVALANVGTTGTYGQVVTDANGRVVSGSGAVLAPGTYTSVEVDAYGRVTNGSTTPDTVGTAGTYNSVITDAYGRVTNGSTINYLTNTSVLSYFNLPSEVQVMPLAFGLYGQPPSLATVGISIIQTTTIVANFVGSQSYCQTTATNPAIFALGYIRGNTNISVGTVTFTPNSYSATFSGTSAILMAGDWLYLTAPATVDATLSTLSVTIMGAKV